MSLHEEFLSASEHRCFCVDSKITSNYSGIGASKNSSVPSAQILAMQCKITLMQRIESGL